MAVILAAVAGAVAHGILRPQLESRGIVPWRVRDTLASTPLILIGSAGIGAAAAIFAGLLAGLNGSAVHLSLTIVLLCTATLLASSALALALGIMALRKLH